MNANALGIGQKRRRCVEVTAESLRDEAEYAYWHDPEFHATVDMAVALVVVDSILGLFEDDRTLAKQAAALALIVAERQADGSLAAAAARHANSGAGFPSQ